MDLTLLKDKIKVIVNELEFELYDLEFVKESSMNILRVVIDSKDIIDLDDCVNVSRRVSTLLDELDPISEEYSLEVTSPGAERELRNKEDVNNAVGKYVYIETIEQNYTGDLVSFQDDVLKIKVKNREINVNYFDINFIRLQVKL